MSTSQDQVQKNSIALANNTTENLTCICSIQNYLYVKVHWDEDDKCTMGITHPCQGQPYVLHYVI
jgi:hypothetical protein